MGRSGNEKTIEKEGSKNETAQSESSLAFSIYSWNLVEYI